MMEDDLRPVDLFLTILTVSFLLLSFSFCGKLELTEEQSNSLFEVHPKIECEKQCCHLLFNRHCHYCRDYRLKNGY